MLKQLFSDFPLVFYGAIVLMAFLLVVLSIPSIIHTANKYQLFDKSDLHRKKHATNISRLGGIGLFCGFTITVLMFATTVRYQEANFLITSCILLFAIGLKDDVYGVSPNTKFGMQILIALILVFLGGFRLTSLYGVLGIWEVYPTFGAFFSVVLIIFVNNAFNLIDGVDGLAATVGIIASLFFGIAFVWCNEQAFAFIAFALLGAILGFLMYNFPPAKIFMGDTGALIVGLVLVVLAIKFIEINKVGYVKHLYFSSAPAIAVAVLIFPIFDSLRIFVLRIINRRSPFQGDRNHIHHRLLQFGLSTKQILLIVLLFNVVVILLTVLLRDLGNFVLIFMQLGLCALANVSLTYVKGKREKKDYTLGQLIKEDLIHLK